MSCCASRRSSPVVFIVVVALSGVAFLGQTIGMSTSGGATSLAASLLSFAMPR